MPIFTGVGTAIVTPFGADGKIDFEVFERLIEFQIANDADAIIVCGTTGEAATLTYDERAASIKFVADTVKGRIPVVAGGGSNSTENTVRLCLDGQKAGADALLCVTPYYNKTTQKGLVAHYSKVASSVDLPILIYNVPSRTGLNIEAETVLALSGIENIVGIKEASNDLAQAARMSSLCGDRFDLYAGNDNEILPMLSLGGIGCISVLGNVAPKNTHDIVNKFLSGDTEGARVMQLEAIPLIDALFCELSPMPVKYMLNLMGYAVGSCRLPLIDLEPESIEVIKKAMAKYGLI